MAVLHPLDCPELAPVLFWELKLALKGRRYDINTVKKQPSHVCTPNSGEEGGHIYQGKSIQGMSLLQKSVWLLVCYINCNICL